MICIPICGDTNAETLRLVELAKNMPAACYELRLDGLEEEPLVETLVAACDRPVVATCRAAAEGGAFAGDADARRDILRRAARAGAAYIDAEAGDFEALGSLGDAIRIVSMHDFEGTPADLQDRIAALCAAPADWVKFAVTAADPSDNIRVFEALGRSAKPAIGIAMGDMGLLSRVLGPRYGSRMTFGSLGAGFESALGQPTARELADVYRVDAITEKTAVYGMYDPDRTRQQTYLGYNATFRELGMDAVCVPLLAADSSRFMEALAYVGRRSPQRLTA